MASDDSIAGNPDSASGHQTRSSVKSESYVQERTTPVAKSESSDRDRTMPVVEPGSRDRGSAPELAGDGSAGRSAGGALEVPCDWGGFLALERIGSGAYADVYLAREKALDRRVALKIYRTLPGEDGRLVTRAPGDVLNEAILMARVNDPNVVRVYGARGLSGTPAYMAPEVEREGISTAASETYSLGVLLLSPVTQ